MAENTKSVDALGIFCGLPSPSPVPAKPPRAERVHRLHDLEAGGLRATDHGSIHALDAVLHVLEELVRDDRAGDEQAERRR